MYMTLTRLYYCITHRDHFSQLILYDIKDIYSLIKAKDKNHSLFLLFTKLVFLKLHLRPLLCFTVPALSIG